MASYILRRDNPNWTADHLRRYLSSNGEDGYFVDFGEVGGPAAVATLILTTTGRKSGLPHSLPLIFGQFGQRAVIIASKGGAAEHPAWFLNLQANPQAQIQIRANKQQVRARIAEGAERTELWQGMNAIYPLFERYQARTARQIPIVVLEPAN